MNHYLVVNTMDEGQILGAFDNRNDACDLVESFTDWRADADVQVWSGATHVDTLRRPQRMTSPFLWRSEESYK